MVIRLYLLCFCVPLCLLSCKKGATDTATFLEEQSTSLYKGSCGSATSKMYWIDNETIVMYDYCNGTVKMVNSSTKAVQFLTIDKNHLLQALHVSDQLPNQFFYTAITKDANGIFSEPFKLFSYNLSSGATTLIQDNITPNPSFGGYIMGNKKLAIESYNETNNQVLIIDLVQATSQKITITGKVQSFSPDDKQLLISTTSQNQITGYFKYDLTCQCTQPITLNTTLTVGQPGNVLWRSEGIFGYKTSNGSSWQFLNLETGSELTSFPDCIARPWVTKNGTLVTAFVKDANYSTDLKGQLVSFDLVSHQSKNVLRATYSLLSGMGISNASVSPDQKKLAFVQVGSDLKFDLRVTILKP